MKINRETLIDPPESIKSHTSIIPIVTTHNPRNRNINRTVHHMNELLKENEQMSKVLNNKQFINSKRQPKNLKRILCKSNFKENTEYNVSKCKDPRCGTLNRGTNIQF